MENPVWERLGKYRVVVDRQGNASAHVMLNMQIETWKWCGHSESNRGHQLGRLGFYP